MLCCFLLVPWFCMQESPVANKIKEAFFSERGLAGNVHRLPFDKLFAIDSVKKVGLAPAMILCQHESRGASTPNISSGV